MNDLIYRDSAIKKFIEGDGDDDFTTGYNFAVDEYRQKLSEIPSVNRWISCDEKLPDDGQICIVKRKFSYEVPCPYMIGVWKSDRNIFSGLRLGTEIEDTISWMPFINLDEV